MEGNSPVTMIAEMMRRCNKAKLLTSTLVFSLSARNWDIFAASGRNHITADHKAHE